MNNPSYIISNIIFREAKTEIWDLEAGLYKQTVDHAVGNGKYVYGIGLYIVNFDFCDSE